MKSKMTKMFQVVQRNILRAISYIHEETYKELYPRYLRKIGINIAENYREGKMGYIHQSVYFDGSDYSLISIGKNTTISRDVIILTHDFSIVKGLKVIGRVPKGRFLKPVRIAPHSIIPPPGTIRPGTHPGTHPTGGGGPSSSWNDTAQ